MKEHEVAAGQRVIFTYPYQVSGGYGRSNNCHEYFNSSSVIDDRYYHQTGTIISTHHSIPRNQKLCKGSILGSFDIKWDNNLSALGKSVWTTWYPIHCSWFELLP